MEYTTLGRTGLNVSRMGLGCGGHSRLGLSTGSTPEQAECLVRQAVELGVNFVDTAENYHTEETVGRALAGLNETVFISTKAAVECEGHLSTATEMRQRVEKSLRRLQRESIDLFNLHGVTPEEYAYGRNELVPVLQDLQNEGKIRFLGLTEQFLTDTSHQMLDEALEDDIWDVMMVGFSILNQSARTSVFPRTAAKNIGTQCMFAVRRALTRPDALRELVADLAAKGDIDANQFDLESPLGFLEEVAETIQDAAYRFCRWEAGIDIVLSGTGQLTHLRENALSINRPPLPEATVALLKTLFDGVDSISGN